MKLLLSTTALVVALGLPGVTLAQAQAPVANPDREQQGAQMSGFLNQREQSDLFASELIGHDVYARSDGAAGTGSGSATQDMTALTRADVDSMETIGQISEIVLSRDGQVRALVIGVGGFLGMGEHDVAVTMDQINFAFDAEDQAETYIVMNTGMDMLRDSPAYDRMSMMDDDAQPERQTSSASQADRTGFAAPRIERDGYSTMEPTDVSTELLMGKTVYDVNDNDVGTVTDMILDDAGSVTDVIIDFGGFLGIGVSHAALGFDELTILTTEGYDDVRLYVDATKDQIQDLPQYEGTN